MVKEAPHDPLIGTILEGRFFVERLIGEGGMGRVYVAEELRLKRRCALKVLLPELCADPGCVDRFLREAQAIAQIHHENVVDIYHLGEDTTGVVFFAMELLAGEDLETRLADRARRPIGWQQICHIMLQVAAAMNSVHAAGLIHRDLKPSNIFLSVRRDGREQVKLLDFGIVKTKDAASLTSTGAAIGTAYYMSPEQILALPLDHRTDIYSLGAVLFEAIAGRMPFVGEAIQVAMQHCNLPAPPLRQVAPDGDYPDLLAELVAHMLAKAPEDRLQTMDAVAQVLHDIIPMELHDSMARNVTGRMLAASTITGSSPSISAAGLGVPSLAPTALADSSPRGQSAAYRAAVDRSGPHATRLMGTAHTVHAATPQQPLRASTVEINFDTGTDVLRPRDRRKPLPVIPISIGVVALALVVLVIALDSRDPKPPPEPIVVAAPPEPPARPEPPLIVHEAPPVPVPVPGEPGPTTTPDPADDPPRKGELKPPRTVDPLKAVRKGATACRRKLNATGKPTMKVDYVLASDGMVTSAKSDGSPLGKCFEGVLRAAKFPPAGSLRFLKIDL